MSTQITKGMQNSFELFCMKAFEFVKQFANKCRKGWKKLLKKPRSADAYLRRALYFWVSFSARWVSFIITKREIMKKVFISLGLIAIISVLPGCVVANMAQEHLRLKVQRGYLNVTSITHLDFRSKQPLPANTPPAHGGIDGKKTSARQVSWDHPVTVFCQREIMKRWSTWILYFDWMISD